MQNGAYVRVVGVRLVQTAELRAVPAAGRVLVPLRRARHGIRVQPFQGVEMAAREGGHERGEPRAEMGVCSEVQGHELRPLVGAEPRDDGERRGPVRPAQRVHLPEGDVGDHAACSSKTAMAASTTNTPREVAQRTGLLLLAAARPGQASRRRPHRGVLRQGPRVPGAKDRPGSRRPGLEDGLGEGQRGRVHEVINGQSNQSRASACPPFHPEPP